MTASAPAPTFTPGDRVLIRAWPAASALTGTYVAEEFGTGRHWVQLDINGRYVAREIVEAIPAASDTSADDHCCDCGTSLPDPDPHKRILINGGALCPACEIAREDALSMIRGARPPWHYDA